MKEIKEVEINNEIVYLRKTFLGWGVINPIKINGKINWKNLIAGGSWIKLGLILLLVVLITGSIWEYSNTTKIAIECLNQTKLMQIIP